MNKWFGIGNITTDLELKKTNGGISFCNFQIAVNRKYKNANGEKTTDFITIVVWRQLAELCGKFLKKGSRVFVLGKLQSRKYQDKNGNNKIIFEVLADEIEFLNSNSDKKKEEAQTKINQAQKDFQEIELSDLPF